MSSSPDHDETFFRYIIDHLDEAVVVVQLDPTQPVGGAVQFASPNVETLFGCAPAQFTADPLCWFQHVHPDDQSPVLESMRRTLAAKAPGRMLYRVRRRTTRDDRWVDDKVIPELDRKETVASVLHVMRDVTADLLARDALQASETRFRRLFEASPDAVHCRERP